MGYGGAEGKGARESIATVTGSTKAWVVEKGDRVVMMPVRWASVAATYGTSQIVVSGAWFGAQAD